MWVKFNGVCWGVAGVAGGGWGEVGGCVRNYKLVLIPWPWTIAFLRR
jgi:hypothetical protein